MRLPVRLLRRPPHQRHQPQPKQKGRNHIHRHRALPALGVLPVADGNPGVLDHHVQPVQLPLGAGAEGPHALVGLQVKRPYLHHARSAARGGFDVGLGGLALFGGPHCQNHALGVEAGEVPGGFEPEADVGAGHDDGFGVVGLFWGREGPPLSSTEKQGGCVMQQRTKLGNRHLDWRSTLDRKILHRKIGGPVRSSLRRNLYSR